MRLVRKSKEPKELVEYRLLPGASYDGLPSDVEAAIRNALVRDQGGLCCYCMRRIHDNENKERKPLERQKECQVRIEHWKSQTKYETLQLSWSNFFAACNGNEGSPPDDQTCDVRKGDRELTLDPLLSKHIASLHYGEATTSIADFKQQGRKSAVKGTRIDSSDSELQRDIERTLNLNHQTLQRNRKQAILAMVDGLVRLTRKNTSAPGQFSDTVLRAELSRCAEFDANDRLPPFAGALAYWIEKRLGMKHRT